MKPDYTKDEITLRRLKIMRLNPHWSKEELAIVDENIEKQLKKMKKCR